MTAPGTPSLPRLLRHNPGTVTHLLEELTGEPLVANVVRQYSTPAEAPNTLGVEAGRTVTHRIAVLKGGVTMVPYVYAESAFVPARPCARQRGPSWSRRRTQSVVSWLPTDSTHARTTSRSHPTYRRPWTLLRPDRPPSCGPGPTG